MSNTIRIEGNDDKNLSFRSSNINAEITQEYCLVDLGKYTFKVSPPEYDNLIRCIEIAREIRSNG